MKVFLSWSGERSRRMATTLREWLPLVIQSVKPFMSAEDTDKGAPWATEIRARLEEFEYGVLCLTPENVGAPWINFEAGALAKHVDASRVAPFLVGLEKGDVPPPLGLFQATAAVDRADVFRLVQSVNKACGDDGLEDARLVDVFGMYWQRLEAEFPKWSEDVESAPQPRDLREMVEELLELARADARRASIDRHPRNARVFLSSTAGTDHWADVQRVAEAVERVGLNDVLTWQVVDRQRKNATADTASMGALIPPGDDPTLHTTVNDA